jgi:3-oxoadipate enol-lactonase / 4-carboxymuconolactone decarboxylase
VIVAVALHHRLEGPAGAPVVMFANSLGTTLEMWDDQAAALAARFRVLRFDTRGHGGSPVPPGPYTVDAMADDALALLDRLGIDRVDFCGVSMGGMVGMTLALCTPERIGRLVLASTSMHLPPEQYTERAVTVRERGMAAIASSVLDRWLTPAAPPALRARMEAMLVSTAPEGYARCCEALAAFDLRGGLGAIRAPTLAIAPTDDPVTPPGHLEAVRDAIPGARLTRLERASHISTVERPEAFTRILASFLDEDDGMRTRRAVLGDDHVDRAIAGTTEFTADFQDLITRYAWGEIWTRPGLDRRMRSAVTITALVAGGRENELAMHVRAARRNGLSTGEIKEILLQCAIYCGVPAANSAFAIARRVLEE